MELGGRWRERTTAAVHASGLGEVIRQIFENFAVDAIGKSSSSL